MTVEIESVFATAEAMHAEGVERWSRNFDQFAAVLSYSFGFISGGNLQVRSSSAIGLVRRHDPM